MVGNPVKNIVIKRRITQRSWTGEGSGEGDGWKVEVECFNIKKIIEPIRKIEKMIQIFSYTLP